MSIKQKITIVFGLLVATILLLFSFFIFQAYESYRRSLMRTRLQRRALSAQAYFLNRNEFQQSSYLTLPEQHEMLFDGANKVIYASNGPNDYVPSSTLLQDARRREVYFTYFNPMWDSEKEGVVLSFRYKHRVYVALVTAYDLTGRQTSRNLVAILIGGNILSLAVIVLAGFLFARRAMHPFDQLISQINAATVNDFSFRLIYKSQPDEANYLAGSFNQLLSRLQQLALSHEHFVGYASHEIRTPLTVVKGMLETGLAYDTTLKSAQESIEKALHRLEGAIELANSLLQLTEVEGLNPGRLLEDINLVDTILDTVGYFQEKYPPQQIELQLTDIFTENSSRIKVVGNNSLLRTALINIIDNACKYSNHQPVKVQITYQSFWVIIAVVDQGVGIPETQLSDVFLPMMRAENVGTVKGFGLGLTLAEKIVKIHGGVLVITSVPNQGTTVSIRLPALSL
ncbi:sensor histidine kinase [Runella sp.]|uniref:sensor histidine kinase n=1 Tax=Runella sp. TaxID=1960881 RepID=UPI003D0AE340